MNLGMDVDLLADLLIDSVKDKEPAIHIGGKENPYLIRWWLRRDREDGSIYLHHILPADDDRALHDHPWDSVTICLRGILREVLPNDEERIIHPGDIVHRDAEQMHRLEIMEGACLDPVHHRRRST